MKYTSDGAIPSGNSVSMSNLIKLAKITGRKDLAEKAKKIGRAFFADVEKNPDFHTQFLVGYDFLFGPSYEVIICGKSDSTDTKEMIDSIAGKFIPNRIIIFKPTGNDGQKITQIAKYTKDYKEINNKATAYVCIDYQCNLPTNNIKKMFELLTP